jgi:hypothetical protein
MTKHREMRCSGSWRILALRSEAGAVDDEQEQRGSYVRLVRQGRGPKQTQVAPTRESRHLIIRTDHAIHPSTSRCPSTQAGLMPDQPGQQQSAWTGRVPSSQLPTPKGRDVHGGACVLLADVSISASRGRSMGAEGGRPGLHLDRTARARAREPHLSGSLPCPRPRECGAFLWSLLHPDSPSGARMQLRPAMAARLAGLELTRCAWRSQHVQGLQAPCERCEGLASRTMSAAAGCERVSCCPPMGQSVDDEQPLTILSVPEIIIGSSTVLARSKI